MDKAVQGSGRLIGRKEGAVGWVVFSNTARRNAVSYEMWRDLPGIVAGFVADPEVRVVVLRGDGEDAFISGADISQFEARRASREAQDEYNAALDVAYQAIVECAKPTIACIKGICVGGGLGLALSCDLRFCTDDTRFRMPAARLGLGYAFGGIARMVQVIGIANAADLFFSARMFNAADALQIGFVSRAWTREEFDRRFEEYCTLIADNAPLTIAAAKAALVQLGRAPGDRDLEQVERLYQRCFESEDYAEGRRAFMEKRPPRFQGR